MAETGPEKPKPRRRRLQFRLRTLFILVAIVAVPCGWFKWKWDAKQRERHVVAEIKRLDGDVSYDWQFVTHRQKEGETYFHIFKAKPVGPLWLRRLLGNDFFGKVVRVNLAHTEIGDYDLAHLEGLPHLHSLNLSNTNITDAGLLYLKSLTTLNYLCLYGTKTTEVAVDDFAKALPGCEIQKP